MEDLGTFIRRLRDDMDISLRELAKRLDCSAAFLSDVELGRRHPSEKVLAEIARQLKTTVEDLRAHDVRAPIEEIKRLTKSDPNFALAFRTVIDKKISAEDLLEFVNTPNSKKLLKKK
jgi:transcriptional regulator with XRE-family HTH domain